ncbi:hypothetical protein [Sorangium sp. So ce513]|uniref:hypothetical protein n=1 Tax=Sorangium sp. So ce513 TaxID=3133315 RepID=UPI003F5FE404
MDHEDGQGRIAARASAVTRAPAAWALNFDDGFTGFNAGESGTWNHFTEAWVKCVR